MHGYIHPIYPEDDIQVAEVEYLVHRSYPEFTAKPLVVTNSAPKLLTESWADAHCRPPSANDPLANLVLPTQSTAGQCEMVMI